MTEAEARAALRAFVAVGEVEHWIAEQRPWQAMSAGWTVPGEKERVAAIRERLAAGQDRNRPPLSVGRAHDHAEQQLHKPRWVDPGPYRSGHPGSVRF